MYTVSFQAASYYTRLQQLTTKLRQTTTDKVRLHVASPFMCPFRSSLNFNIVAMMMVPFDRQNGLRTRYILPIRVPSTIDTMINFDGHGYGEVTSK